MKRETVDCVVPIQFETGYNELANYKQQDVYGREASYLLVKVMFVFFLNFGVFESITKLLSGIWLAKVLCQIFQSFLSIEIIFVAFFIAINYAHYLFSALVNY